MVKVLLFLSIALSIATAGMGYLNKVKLTEQMEARQTAENKVSELTPKLAAAEAETRQKEADLKTAQKEKEQAESNLAVAKTDLESTKEQLAAYTSRLSDRESQITQLQSQLDTTKMELETAKSQTAAAAPAETSGPSEEVQAEIQEKDTLIAKLQGDLESSRQQLEELRTREQNRAASKMRLGLRGKVLAVNQAWNFVVLNLGDKNGIVGNAEMLVKRGSNLVGKIRITSVEPSTSIADIVTSSVPRGMTIQPGDSVIYQSSEE